MIKTFRNKALAAFFHDNRNARKLPVQNADRVRRMLHSLSAATRPGDLDLPGFHFHSLAPGMPGRYSVRVTGNYRITFAFEGQDAVDVDLEDYH